MSTPEDMFFKAITKKADAPFDAVAFFKGASFYPLIDLTLSKLADDGMSTPMTTPGVKPPKIETVEPGGAPVNMFQQSKRPKGAPNNPSGFHGMADKGDSGGGFNPAT